MFKRHFCDLPVEYVVNSFNFCTLCVERYLPYVNITGFLEAVYFVVITDLIWE